MNYKYWIVASSVVALGLYIATSINFEVPSRNKLLVAEYESPGAVAKKLLETLKPELQKHAVVFLGVTPESPEDIELWQQLVEQAKGTPLEFQVVVVEKKLPYIENFENAAIVDVTTERERLIAGIEAARSENLRIAVILPYHYSSQLVVGNPVSVLKEQYDWDILSLTAVKFPLTRQQEATFEPACRIEERQDPTGTGKLGCTVIRSSQKLRQHKFQDNQYTSLIEEITATDFLVLFNRNSGSR